MKDDGGEEQSETQKPPAAMFCEFFSLAPTPFFLLAKILKRVALFFLSPSSPSSESHTASLFSRCLTARRWSLTATENHQKRSPRQTRCQNLFHYFSFFLFFRKIGVLNLSAGGATCRRSFSMEIRNFDKAALVVICFLLENNTCTFQCFL